MLDEQQRKLVEENIRLVPYVIHTYFRKMPTEDEIGEGYIGLCEAAEQFNPNLGNKFSTFAVWKIRTRVNVSYRQMMRRKQYHHVPLDKPVGDEAVLSETINDEPASMRMTIAEIETFVDDVSLEIFKLLARGYTQDQASALMGVTQGTISRRIKRIREACLN